MKKLITSMLVCTLLNTAFAQTDITRRDWISQVPKDCFCCSSSIFSMPQLPPINGPKELCACDKAAYSTITCEGAKIVWKVTDSVGQPVAFSGQGTSTISITGSIGNTKNLIVSVSISCGDRTVKNQLLTIVKSANPAFPYSITANGNGGYVITTSSTGTTASYWRFAEITSSANGQPNSNVACSDWGYGNVLYPAGGGYTSVGGGQNFTWAGTLSPNKIYRIIHWVDKCSLQWNINCAAVKWVCFKITPSALKLVKGAKVQPAEIIESEINANPSEEMLKGINAAMPNVKKSAE